MTAAAGAPNEREAESFGGEAPFAAPEGLRALLQRLHDAGPGAWRRDPDAAALMVFTARRYARLAGKYDLAPEDAAVAAFETMLNESTRTAADPWAVVTHAVRITLIAEQRANGLLTSTSRARRPEYSVFHDAERFSDHETDLTEYHPAFHIPDPTGHDSDGEEPPADGGAGLGIREEAAVPTGTGDAVASAVQLLQLLGWDAEIVQNATEYVCSRLPAFGDRASAYDGLRRYKLARVVLDLPHPAWIGLLRLLLGNPAATTAAERRGILARLLIGETLPHLLADDVLIRTARAARPAPIRPGVGKTAAVDE
jgi:hypothetical protein